MPPLLHSGTRVYCHGHCTLSIYTILYVVMYAYMFEHHHIRTFYVRVCVYIYTYVNVDIYTHMSLMMLLLTCWLLLNLYTVFFDPITPYHRDSLL